MVLVSLVIQGLMSSRCDFEQHLSQIQELGRAKLHIDELDTRHGMRLLLGGLFAQRHIIS